MFPDRKVGPSDDPLEDDKRREGDHIDLLNPPSVEGLEPNVASDANYNSPSLLASADSQLDSQSEAFLASLRGVLVQAAQNHTDTSPPPSNFIFRALTDHFFSHYTPSDEQTSGALQKLTSSYTDACSDFTKRAVDAVKSRKLQGIEGRKNMKRPNINEPKAAMTALVSMKEKDEREKRLQRLGLPLNNFLDLEITNFEAFVVTLKIMVKMLLLTAFMAAVIGSYTYCISEVLAGTTLEKSAEEQYGFNNLTAFELLNKEGFDDVLHEERKKLSIMLTMPTSLGALWLALSACVTFNAAINGCGTYLKLALPGVVCVASVALYHSSGTGVLSGLGVAGIAMTGATGNVAAMVIELIDNKQSESGAYLVSLAGKRAEHLLRDDDTELKRVTTKQKLLLGLVSVAPSLFTFGVVMLYVTVIFWLFGLYDATAWQVSVTLLALGIKIVGNKRVVMLLSSGKLAAWVVDFQLFGYEYVTAVLLRVLQLSIPDENTAQMMALVGAFAEVTVRTYFFNSFMLDGMKKHVFEMDEDEKFKYAMRGKLRVGDGANDMIVEYLSSVVAAMFIVWLVPTGAFNFATNEEIQVKTVVNLMMYQLVPELFLDTYVTFMEIKGGLRMLHERMWSSKAGADPESKYWAHREIGDMFKSTVMKTGTSIAITGFVLMATLA